jgi:hypothetical protein
LYVIKARIDNGPALVSVVDRRHRLCVRLPLLSWSWAPTTTGIGLVRSSLQRWVNFESTKALYTRLNQRSRNHSSRAQSEPGRCPREQGIKAVVLPVGLDDIEGLEKLGSQHDVLHAATGKHSESAKALITGLAKRRAGRDCFYIQVCQGFQTRLSVIRISPPLNLIVITSISCQ